MNSLHYASFIGHINVVRFLVLNGADTNSIDFNDSTPLHIASYKGNIDVVQYLILNGAEKYLHSVFPKKIYEFKIKCLEI